METTSTSTTTTYRGVYRWDEGMGSSYLPFRETADEAWADVAGQQNIGPEFPGHWAVEVAVTAVVRQDVRR